MTLYVNRHLMLQYHERLLELLGNLTNSTPSDRRFLFDLLTHKRWTQTQANRFTDIYGRLVP